MLRYTNAIAEKYRKYRGYLRDRIIHKNDAFVIAINGAALSYKWTQAERDAPRFLKAVYPLGAYQLLLDRRTGEIVGQQNEPRFSIVKASGANVATMPFLERRSRGISAILMNSCRGRPFQPWTWEEIVAASRQARQTRRDNVIEMPKRPSWRETLAKRIVA